MNKLIFILMLIVLLQMAGETYAMTGVQSIISNDMQQNGEWDTFDTNASSESSGYNYNPNTSSSWGNLDLSFANMKEAVSSTLGVPEANYLVLVLFSLAALLQMGRVIAGTGDWLAFTVRVIVVLAFLRCYSDIFDGLELFFQYISDNILNGQSAYESFWSKEKDLLTGIYDYIRNLDIGMEFLKQGAFSIVTIITSALAFATYLLIFMVQSTLAILLRYLGPILISLAIIPETDFTSGYITTTLQMFSWSIVTAILIKVLGTTLTVGTMMQLNVQDMVAISAMNICYALAFMAVPIMTGMIFTGKGLGGFGKGISSLGGNAVSFATGAAYGWVMNKIRGNKNSHGSGYASSHANENNGSASSKSQSRFTSSAGAHAVRRSPASKSKTSAAVNSYGVNQSDRHSHTGRIQFNQGRE